MLLFGGSTNYTLVELSSECDDFDALGSLGCTSFSQEVEVGTDLPSELVKIQR